MATSAGRPTVSGSHRRTRWARAAAPRPCATTSTSRPRSRPRRPWPEAVPRTADHLEADLGTRPRPDGDEHRPALPGAGHQPVGHRRRDRAGRGHRDDVDPVQQGGHHAGPLGPGRGHEREPLDRHPRLGGGDEAQAGQADGRAPGPGRRGRRHQREQQRGRPRAGPGPQHRDGAAPAQEAAGEQRPQRRRPPATTARPRRPARRRAGPGRPPGCRRAGRSRARSGSVLDWMPAGDAATTIVLRSVSVLLRRPDRRGRAGRSCPGRPPPRRRTPRPPGPGRRPPGW